MESRNYKLYVHVVPNGKRYYGITCQKVEDRWKRGKGYVYHNKHFYNAIEKYGWDNIKHEVLFDNLTKEEACLLEQMYILLYNTDDRKYGYNKTYGGEIALKTQETRNKMSESNKGKTKVINLDTGEIFNSVIEASKKYNIGRTNISNVCTGKINTAGGYRWMYLNDWDKLSKKEKEYKKNEKIKKKSRKSIINIDTGEIFDSMTEASKKYNIDSSCISKVCKNIRETVGGYKWMYLDDWNKLSKKEKEYKKNEKIKDNGRPKLVINLDTYEVFESMVKAGKSIGRSRKGIRRAIRTSGKCGGYHWAYYEEVKEVIQQC